MCNILHIRFCLFFCLTLQAVLNTFFNENYPITIVISGHLSLTEAFGKYLQCRNIPYCLFNAFFKNGSLTFRNAEHCRKMFTRSTPRRFRRELKSHESAVCHMSVFLIQNQAKSSCLNSNPFHSLTPNLIPWSWYQPWFRHWKDKPPWLNLARSPWLH